MTRSVVALAAAGLFVSAPLRPSAQGARNWDQAFRAIPDARNIGDYMSRMSARPHHLGSAYYTGYSVKTLPGVREAIEQKSYAEAETEVVRVAKALDRETALLDQASEDLERLR